MATTTTQDPEARASVYYDSRSAGSSSSNLHEGSSTLHGSSVAVHNQPQQQKPVATMRSVRSRDELLAAGYQIPKLSEKTSFGDMRNVHYLMPDLPPPQKD